MTWGSPPQDGSGVVGSLTVAFQVLGVPCENLWVGSFLSLALVPVSARLKAGHPSTHVVLSGDVGAAALWQLPSHLPIQPSATPLGWWRQCKREFRFPAAALHGPCGGAGAAGRLRCVVQTQSTTHTSYHCSTQRCLPVEVLVKLRCLQTHRHIPDSWKAAKTCMPGTAQILLLDPVTLT